MKRKFDRKKKCDLRKNIVKLFYEKLNSNGLTCGTKERDTCGLDVFDGDASINFIKEQLFDGECFTFEFKSSLMWFLSAI